MSIPKIVKENFSESGSQNSHSGNASDTLNQCNTAPILSPDDTHTESKTLPFDSMSTEPIGFERYLTKLHTNLDSRYPIPSVVNSEMKKPQQLSFNRPTLTATKRFLFGASPFNLNRPSEAEQTTNEALTTSPKKDASVKLNAKDWPNPLTSQDQATLAQQFCAYFYQRYCTAIEDVQSNEVPANLSTVSNAHETESHDRLKCNSTGEPQREQRPKSVQREQKAVYPFFYTGSLADAMKLCERPSGRPWPAILLYLHNDHSPYTYDFVHNILCSLREDYKMQDPPGCNTRNSVTGKSPAGERTGDDPFTAGSQGFTDRPERTAPTDLSPSTGSQVKPHRSSANANKIENQQVTNTVANSEKARNASTGGLRKPSRALPSIASLSERDLSETRTKQSASEKRVKPSPKKTTNRTLTQSANNDKCAGTKQVVSALFPVRQIVTESDDLGSIEPLPLAATLPVNGERMDLDREAQTDMSEEKTNLDEAYRTVFSKKSFRGLLLERSAGLVPWDCTGIRARAYLAAAFPGTRLAQWLTEWKKPECYPIMVAVGRTAERTVVCSCLSGPTATALTALSWLNEVTLAHFYNYREPIIPRCPERSDKLPNSPYAFTPPMEQTSSALMLPATTPQPSPMTVTANTNPTTSIVRMTSSAKPGTGEYTEHTFISQINARPAPKRSVSPVAVDDIPYRVAKTPQNQEGPLSALFEVAMELPSNKLRERLKRMQHSFKNASAVLAKSVTSDSLSSWGIQLHFSACRKLFSSAKSTSSQILVDALCNPPPPEPRKPSSNALCATHSEYGSYQAEPELQNRVESGSSRARSSRSLSHNSDKPGSPRSRNSELKSKRTGHYSTEGTNRLLTEVASNRLIAKSVNQWWYQLAESRRISNTENMVQFYERFSERFTVDFPSTPSFMLGRLQTAILRSMDIQQHEQIAPMLIYLHDNHAPGVEHFVANVLCSRRFANKLFDHGVHIWPYDVSTGEASHVNRSSRLTSSRLVDRPDFHRSKPHPTEQSSRSYTDMERLRDQHGHRRTVSSLSRLQLHHCTDNTHKSNGSRAETERDRSVPSSLSRKRSMGLHSLSRDRFPGTNNHEAADVYSRAAQQLIDYFTGHPAEEALKRILTIPVLPTLINLYYDRDTFSITHLLVPYATTKEAIGWLSTVLKLYSNSQTQ